jgi:hypothetical protein
VIPLLITSAARPEPDLVVLNDTNLRIGYTLESIKLWAKHHPTLEIVLCDGSGYDFSKMISEDDHLVQANIEVLFFQNDSARVRDKGKGYGEAQIVQYALENSKTLARHPFFSKCTAKLFLKNYSEITMRFSGSINIEKGYLSIMSTNFNDCDTRFYITSKEYYRRHLLDSYHFVDDPKGIYLEHVFAQKIKESGVSNVDFRCKPLLQGYSGTSGKYMDLPDETKKRQLIRWIRRTVT